MKDEKFCVATDAFFHAATVDYLNFHLNSYIKRYGKTKLSTEGWGFLLHNLVNELEYQIDIDKEQDPEDIVYPFDIKMIKTTVTVKDHKVTILFIDLDTEVLLKTTIIIDSIEEKINFRIGSETGKMVFDTYKVGLKYKEN